MKVRIQPKNRKEYSAVTKSRNYWFRHYRKIMATLSDQDERLDNLKQLYLDAISHRTEKEREAIVNLQYARGQADHFSMLHCHLVKVTGQQQRKIEELKKQTIEVLKKECINATE